MVWHKRINKGMVAVGIVCTMGLNCTAQSPSPDPKNPTQAKPLAVESRAASTQAVPTRALVVLGASGEETYGESFRTWGARWAKALEPVGCHVLDGTSASDSKISQREEMVQWLERIQADQPMDSTTPYWVILIGHGTHDRSSTKFNLRGPDISSEEISKMLKVDRRWIFIDCSSSSGPFLSSLSGSNRVVITATKSGAEQNYARFGEYLSLAITDPASDLDHDSSVSVLEAFLAASKGVSNFYKGEGRLASEQSLLDDNGDKKGTPATFFRGIRPVKAPADGLSLDGSLARQIAILQFAGKQTFATGRMQQVEEIELQVESLRKRKLDLPEAEYYEKLEVLFLALAECLSDSADGSISGPQP